MTTFPSFGNAAPLSSGTGTSRNPSLPTGLGTGQVVIGICCSKNNATHSWSSNFTKLLQVNSGASFTISVGYFFWTPGISAPSVSWTGSVASACQLFSYKDCDTITAGTMNTGSTSPHTSTGLNTVNDASTVVYLDQCATNTALTTPTGYTSRVSNADATSVTATNIGDKTVATKGTGSGNISTTGGAAAYGQVQIILSQSILPGQPGDGQSGQQRAPVRINDLMQLVRNVALLAPQAAPSLPPGEALPATIFPVLDIDQSQFVAPPQYLLTSPLPIITTTDWPLPKVPVQPHRSQFVSPLEALLNSIFPGQPDDWPLPIRVQQPDRSLLTTTLPLMAPLPPQTPPPSHQLQDLPIIGPQPNRHFFSQAWQTFIPCASFSHAYSNAYCGGVSPPSVSPGLHGLPIRVKEPDRTFLQAINPAFIPCASFNSAYSDAYCGGTHPFALVPAMSALPIRVVQPDRSYFSSANPAIIPNLAVPPPGRGDFELPRRVAQPNRSFEQGILPTSVPQNPPPPRHQRSELPQVPWQFNRSFFDASLPIAPPGNQPPPRFALSELPRTVVQPDRTFLYTPVFTRIPPPASPQFSPLQQAKRPTERTFDYSLFGRYPVIIPAPPQPPPHKHHLWNPPNQPGNNQWTAPGEGGQLWVKVTSGNQSWQSKVIPNS